MIVIQMLNSKFGLNEVIRIRFLIIGNDEGLYNLAREFMEDYKGRKPYEDFVYSFELAGKETPDGVKWIDRSLSLRPGNGAEVIIRRSNRPVTDAKPLRVAAR